MLTMVDHDKPFSTILAIVDCGLDTLALIKNGWPCWPCLTLLSMTNYAWQHMTMVDHVWPRSTKARSWLTQLNMNNHGCQWFFLLHFDIIFLSNCNDILCSSPYDVICCVLNCDDIYCLFITLWCCLLFITL